MITTARQLKDLVRNLSKKKSADAQILMRNYMMERFLERISLSEYKNQFILKGGMLVAAMVGLDARATMDLDATIKGTILSTNDMFLTQPFGLNIGTLFPGPLAFRWTFQFYDQSQTSAELADLLERVSPYFLNGVQVFGVIIVEAIVFLALIAFVYRRQEI